MVSVSFPNRFASRPATGRRRREAELIAAARRAVVPVSPRRTKKAKIPPVCAYDGVFVAFPACGLPSLAAPERLI
jgi:hypothetical protein